VVDTQVIFESSVILDYLDEVYAPRLHPDDPLRRAQHKAWMAYGSALLMDQVAVCKALDEQEYRAKLESFANHLKHLTIPVKKGLITGDMPFCLLDAAYAPLFMRMKIMAEIDAELSSICPPQIDVWAKRLLNRASVSGSVVDDFTPRFINYFASKGSWLMHRLKVSL
jgi:glutathione S-transferase